ncbi:LCP family protein [Actinosynnema sp. NPDC023658]|uniref:LCP family protein n=1 Tax=Actinosynnema sp. NPDC023658 TaxID=3155465 RepID=UPI00340B0B5D
MNAARAISLVSERIRSEGLDYPTEDLTAERFQGGWCVFAPVMVVDGDPEDYLDDLGTRSVFLVGLHGRIQEVTSDGSAEDARSRFEEACLWFGAGEPREEGPDAFTGPSHPDFGRFARPLPPRSATAFDRQAVDAFAQALAHERDFPGWLIARLHELGGLLGGAGHMIARRPDSLTAQQLIEFVEPDDDSGVPVAVWRSWPPIDSARLPEVDTSGWLLVPGEAAYHYLEDLEPGADAAARLADAIAERIEQAPQWQACGVADLFPALIAVRRDDQVDSIAVLLGTGYAWANLSTLLSKISTTDVISDAGGGEKPADGSVDILMVGMDSRTDSKGNPLPQEILNELHAGNENDGGLNTDTLILMHVPNDGGKAIAVSFPRDSYVQIAGNKGRHKINSAYGYGKTDAIAQLEREGVDDPVRLDVESRTGAAKNLINTIENLTGVTIDHYAEINLVGFYEITKAVGGVDVCLNQATRDDMSGASFAAGPQRIQGREALAFVRQRYGLLRGDLDRIVRQQVFMAGLAKQILSAGTLSDPGKLSSLIEALTKSIVLDKDWDVLRFATQMKDLTGGNLEFETIPTGNPELETAEDGLAVEINERDVKKFFKNLGADPNATTTTTGPAVDNATVTVEVRNASGTPGLAGRVLQELVAQRFVDGGTDNASPLDVSVARYGVGGEAGAEAVSEALGGLELEEDDNIPAGHVRVFVGADYSGPGAQNLAGGPVVGLDGARRQPGTSSTSEEPPITADGVRCVN